MKHFIAPFLLASTLFAAPASAEVVHQSSLNHEGRELSVSYEPRIVNSHKQTGIGPRSSPSCLWTTSIAIERIVNDTAGQPIAALTRVVAEEQGGSGNHVGHCSNIDPKRMSAFGGDREKLRSLVAAHAERDAQSLRTELASLDTLHVAGVS